MTRARQNANISPAVGRNMVINGSMNVAARSSSVAGIGASSGYFTCDRWTISTGSSAGRLTMTQTADGPNGISANCIKLDCTTADTSIAGGEYLLIQQPFEGQNLQRIGKGVAGAKQITVSFYVKASAAFTFACELFDVDNTRQISKLFNVTTDWNRIELIFPADVDDGSSPFDDDNAASLELQFWLHAGTDFTSGTLNSSSWANNSNTKRAAGIDSFYSSTDNNFFITGVQMEVGPVATDFEQEDIGVTLAKCQRYFQSFGNSTYTCMGYGSVVTAGIANYLLNNVVPMRATPSVSYNNLQHSDGASAYALTSLVISTAQSDENNALLIGGQSGNNLTQFRPVRLEAANNSAGRIKLDAEL